MREVAKPDDALAEVVAAVGGQLEALLGDRRARELSARMHTVVLDPLHFIARLCALMPPTRFHMLRYHGVLAAHASPR